MAVLAVLILFSQLREGWASSSSSQASGPRHPRRSSVGCSDVYRLRRSVIPATQAAIEMEKERLLTVRVAENSPVAQAAACVSGQNIAGAPTLADLLRRPHVHYSLLAEHGHGAEEIGRAERERAEIDIKYAGFIERQSKQLEKVRQSLDGCLFV